jgi:hypothetical protein
MPIGDVVFLVFIAVAVGSVVLFSLRSKRQQPSGLPGVSPDRDADAGP